MNRIIARAEGTPVTGTRRSIPLTVATLTTTIATLASCGGGDKGPTAAEAGALLKADITKALNGINAHDINVTDPGSRDIPCGKDKAKRSYAVTATRDVPGLDDPTGLVHEMIGNLVSQYKIVNPKIGPGTGSSSDLRAEKEHTNITLRAPSRGHVQISGSTDCLRAK